MSFLGRKWPTPVAAPMAPFYIAGIVILYGINAGATAYRKTPEFKDDPRNARFLAASAAANGGH
ncbi:ATP synthase j chain-domain-containing protein [Phyllosticta citricarpa]|uniref:ATP synthase j chain-domain-containing protein n=3 Tax=Phyllosticta TaxID=121621 RepID=A0ABR1MLS1_9PEZI